jgi:hypothetical protein
MFGPLNTLFLFIAVCSRLLSSGQHCCSSLHATIGTGAQQDKGFALRTTMSELVVGTRLHLGNATVPPPDNFWSDKLESFGRFCGECSSDETGPAAHGVVAVDGTDKIPGYSLVETIRRLVASSPTASTAALEVLPVCPWGRFVPALNALALHAASVHRAKRIMFVSAETTAPKSSIDALLSATKKEDGSDDESVLVAGARLAGHDYRAVPAGASTSSASLIVPLNGRTSPWNTLAVWNLKKLAITGFQLVSDALVADDDTNKEPWYAGIEEVVAIALLQKLLGRDQARAKLVHVSGITWDQTFDDPKRRKWHEYKMESKATRAAHQLELTRLDGEVIHC